MVLVLDWVGGLGEWGGRRKGEEEEEGEGEGLPS